MFITLLSTVALAHPGHPCAAVDVALTAWYVVATFGGLSGASMALRVYVESFKKAPTPQEAR